MKYNELARAKKGSVFYYEVELDERVRESGLIKTYAGQAKGRIKTSYLNAFDMKHQPLYLIRCVVEKQGNAREAPGARSSNHNLRQYIYKKKLLTLQEIADETGSKYNSLYTKIVQRKQCKNGSDITDLV